MMVSIPDYLIARLNQSVQIAHPTWTSEQISGHVSTRLEALSRTPPIPWVQNNDWVICGDDFAYYLGERTQEDLNAMAPDGNGLAYLAQLIDAPETVGKWQNVWDAIEAEWTTVFLFLCPQTGAYHAVMQSF